MAIRVDSTAPKKDDGEDGDASLLREARERFKLCEDGERDIRTKALEVLRFRTGEQWNVQEKAQREADRRPCLTINRLPQHIQQVTNDQRQNRPSLKIHPLRDGATQETAK